MRQSKKSPASGVGQTNVEKETCAAEPAREVQSQKLTSRQLIPARAS
jgi:hypothetical protein